MAQPSESGKYLTLDDVRVSYDSRNDQIILTSTDRELKALGGLKLDINGKNRNHLALRALLDRHGVIQEGLWPRQRRAEIEAHYEKLKSSELLLGTNAYGNPVIWDLDGISHFWLYGVESLLTGQALLGQAVEIGYQPLVLNVGSYLRGNNNPSTWVVNYLEQAIEDRQKVDGESERIILEIRGLEDLTVLAKDPQDSSRMERTLAIRIVNLLESIGRLGRSVGIHLVVEVEDPKPELISLLDRLVPSAGSNAATIVFNRVPAAAVPASIRSYYRPLESYAPNRAQLFVNGIDALIEPLKPTGNRPTPVDKR